MTRPKRKWYDSILKSTWLNSKEHYPLRREVEKLGACFNYYNVPQQMPMLEEMAGCFPGVKIVIDHLGKPDLKQADPWTDFRKMFRLIPQVWVSASEPYELSLTKQYPYKELEFVEQVLDFYSRQDRDLLPGQNALRIWEFPS